jgi:hypothetical protein
MMKLLTPLLAVLAALLLSSPSQAVEEPVSA